MLTAKHLVVHHTFIDVTSEELVAFAGNHAVDHARIAPTL
jgi:hypothetical protein